MIYTHTSTVHPLPLEYNKTEVFGPKTVTVFLEFEEESGIKYTASVLPQANSSSDGRGRIQLVLLYNTIYSVNITSTLCGQTSSSSTVILNYGEFYTTIIIMIMTVHCIAGCIAFF